MNVSPSPCVPSSSRRTASSASRRTRSFGCSSTELEREGYSLNELVRDLPEASPDWDEFYQLIGYSVSGYGDLSRVSPESVEAADTIAVKLSKTRKPKEST